MRVELGGAGKPGPGPHNAPKPWSLPLSAEVSASTLRDFNDQMQRIPGLWRSGVGGTYPVAVPAAAAKQSANRGAAAMFQRVFHHDLLDTALLHGQERVSELLRIGERILRTGAMVEDPRKNDYAAGILLVDGSRAVIRPETLEPMGYSLRILNLRTQLWAREFPYEGLKQETGPDSQRAIESAASTGLNHEYSRLFDLAVVLASQPGAVRQKLLALAPPHPCKPYAEAISAEFERDYKHVEYAAWRLRKSLEPGGDAHRNAAVTKVSAVSVADKVFVHRLVRFRLDTLRRGGSELLNDQLGFGREAQSIGRHPLTEQQLFGGPLKGLPIPGSFALLAERKLGSLARADHTGWLQVSDFVESLGLNELRQPRGAARGDDAHQRFENLAQSTVNRVKLNVLARAVTLGSSQNSSVSKYLERHLLSV